MEGLWIAWLLWPLQPLQRITQHVVGCLDLARFEGPAG